MKIVALIPARMGSSRFPGKPMAPILGKPMIGHVYERVRQSSLLTLTAVATCDREIYDYVQSIGGVAVMTGDQHERASDRCAEALLELERRNRERYDIVIMVQGDEPMTHPDMIAEAVQPLLTDARICVANLMAEIRDEAEFTDRNCIKVVCDLDNNAIYFSREPIPTRYKSTNIPMAKQVCVIPFRRDFLQFTEPRFGEALQRVRAAAQQRGVACGIHVVAADPAELRVRRSEGYRFIAYSLDVVFLRTGAAAGIDRGAS